MKAWTSFFLACVAGFVDTATFTGAGGIFSAHVTGNFVLFAASIVHGIENVDYLKMLLFIPFMGAAAMTAGLSKLEVMKANYESLMCTAMGILLLIAGFYFLAFPGMPDELMDMASLVIGLPVFAMGILNASRKIISPSEPATTVMTGNVTQMMLFSVGYKHASLDQARNIEKSKAIFRIIVGFTIGCLLSAWMVSKFSLAALLIPGFAMLAIAYVTRAHDQ